MTKETNGLKIYLIRHGEKDNQGKFLSKRGINNPLIIY